MQQLRNARRADRGLLAVLVVVVGLLGTQVAGGTAPARGSSWGSTAHLDPGLPAAGDQLQKVIVTARGGAAAAAQAVRSLGGSVTADLPLVDGVSATLPAFLLPELAGTAGVTGVTANRTARFESLTYDGTTTASNVTRTTGATTVWEQQNLGAGVGIAVLDTGVSQMKDFEGRLVSGPDLSGEGTLVDSYGHGTVMAGVAAGSGADSAGMAGGAYTGVAPKAHVVSVKVAGRNGAVDVSTILQGMHWVLVYKDQFNVRVLNLSWGTLSTQDPKVDPLNDAVQRLWQSGIVVVVAAGNAGPNKRTITKPADDPMVLSVGAYDDKGDADPGNDALSAWSSRGPTAHGLSKPDLVVPGRTLVAARSFGSKVEADNPEALISPSYIKGSGTSQAAAVTSGLAALVLAAHPDWTPDQVKRVLISTATPLGVGAINEGAGRGSVAAALAADPGPASWQTPTATGLGSLERSRGEPWSGSAWTGSAWTGSAWTGSAWTGSAWTGSAWTGSAWTTDQFSTALYGDDAFLTVFWGPRPRAGRFVAGESNEPVRLGGI